MTNARGPRPKLRTLTRACLTVRNPFYEIIDDLRTPFLGLSLRRSRDPIVSACSARGETAQIVTFFQQVEVCQGLRWKELGLPVRRGAGLAHPNMER